MAATTDTAAPLLGLREWEGSIWSGGAWQPGGAGEAAAVAPATGEQLARVGIASVEDVACAAARAGEAQRAWAATSFEQRAAVMRCAGQLFERHAAEVQWWIVRESGAVPGKGEIETHIAAQECFESSALASAPLGAILPTAQPRLSFSRRVPAGVVAVISPFNFPLILSIRSVAPALALGNAVVLKPDPRTAVCGGVVLARIFEEAGLPAGLLSVLPGGATDVGAALIADPRVRLVSFTGSTAAGRLVGAAAGHHLKRVHLELSGNSALIVLDDADLDRAIGAAAWGSFNHQGQICMTTGRHLVHDSVAEEFVARLAEKADALKVGDPASDAVALGPVIDAGQRDKIHALVTASAASGARIAAGGTYEGLFYRPTVIAGATCETAAWANEVFGPVAPVARFSSLDEAAALANDTHYGLSLGVITADAMKGLALADRIPTGIVHVNDQTVGDEAVAPFGGVGHSGTGSRFGGAAANIEAFTEGQWITLQGEVPVYPF